MNDKYVRNDDINDDFESGGQETTDIKDINIVFKSKTPNQYVKEIGGDEISKESSNNLNIALQKLSPQELALWNRIRKGQSIRRAARLMKVSRDTATSYWNRIQEKLR